MGFEGGSRGGGSYVRSTKTRGGDLMGTKLHATLPLGNGTVQTPPLRVGGKGKELETRPTGSPSLEWLIGSETWISKSQRYFDESECGCDVPRGPLLLELPVQRV